MHLTGCFCLFSQSSWKLKSARLAAAELRSVGMGDITILNTDSIDLFAESGPALISFSHQFGNLLIDSVKQGIEIWAFQDTAAIEGGLGSVSLGADEEYCCDSHCTLQRA